MEQSSNGSALSPLRALRYLATSAQSSVAGSSVFGSSIKRGKYSRANSNFHERYNTEYLRPDFDPGNLTVPYIKELLAKHDILLSRANPSKDELCQIWNERLVPRIPEFRQSIEDAKRAKKEKDKARRRAQISRAQPIPQQTNNPSEEAFAVGSPSSSHSSTSTIFRNLLSRRVNRDRTSGGQAASLSHSGSASQVESHDQGSNAESYPSPSHGPPPNLAISTARPVTVGSQHHPVSTSVTDTTSPQYPDLAQIPGATSPMLMLRERQGSNASDQIALWTRDYYARVTLFTADGIPVPALVKTSQLQVIHEEGNAEHQEQTLNIAPTSANTGPGQTIIAEGPETSGDRGQTRISMTQSHVSDTSMRGDEVPAPQAETIVSSPALEQALLANGIPALYRRPDGRLEREI